MNVKCTVVLTHNIPSCVHGPIHQIFALEWKQRVIIIELLRALPGLVLLLKVVRNCEKGDLFYLIKYYLLLVTRVRQVIRSMDMIVCMLVSYRQPRMDPM